MANEAQQKNHVNCTAQKSIGPDGKAYYRFFEPDGTEIDLIPNASLGRIPVPPAPAQRRRVGWGTCIAVGAAAAVAAAGALGGGLALNGNLSFDDDDSDRRIPLTAEPSQGGGAAKKGQHSIIVIAAGPDGRLVAGSATVNQESIYGQNLKSTGKPISRDGDITLQQNEWHKVATGNPTPQYTLNPLQPYNPTLAANKGLCSAEGWAMPNADGRVFHAGDKELGKMAVKALTANDASYVNAPFDPGLVDLLRS